MQLKLYDTLSREKRPFEPLDPTRVRIYVCGPTVYDSAHIGNARPVSCSTCCFGCCATSTATSTSSMSATSPTWTTRSTRAQPRRGVPIRDRHRGDRTGNYQRGHGGARLPAADRRAARDRAHRRDDAMIERLVHGARLCGRGHVLFNCRRCPTTASSSRRSLDEMIAGARVDVAPYKRDPVDFVLWKPSKPGEPAWDSPVGIARRPAGLAHRVLGDGVEAPRRDFRHPRRRQRSHLSPPRERDRAVACARSTRRIARYWMHNGFLQVEGEKMSKSLGNFVTMRALLAEQPNDRRWGEIVRFNMLRTHYRQPIDWTRASLDESVFVYSNLRRAVTQQIGARRNLRKR